MAKVKTQLVIEGRNDTQKAFSEVNRQLDTMSQRMATAGRALLGVFSAAQFAGAVKAISQVSDAYGQMQARLKLAAGTQENFNLAQAGLKRIASETQAPLESLITLYSRISKPLQEAGRSQGDILAVTEAVATSFRISGASAQEAQNGVVQFAQALGAGALRGDEFNSVAEQAPRLMQALAAGLGVPIGALKEMAAQGELTAEVVTDALVGQLEALRVESQSLPQTVGGAMVELSDRIQEAIGRADMGELIAAIEGLGDTLTDPAVVQGLTGLVTGMATLAGWAIKIASEFAELAKGIGTTVAQVAGYTDELDNLEIALKKVRNAQTGDSWMGSSTVDLLAKWLAPEKLDEWAANLEAKILEARAKINGLSVEGQAKADADAAAAAEAAKEAARQRQAEYDAEVNAHRRYVTDLARSRDRLVQDAKSGGKALVAEERSANAALKKIKDDRLKIEERYREALIGLSGETDPSYGAASAMKVAAQQALRNGDIQTAQTQAQAALKMLQDLAQAGESTYGFEGFINELKAIELAANDIEQTNAEQKITAIQERMALLKKEAEALEGMPISVKADEASMEAAKVAMQQLAAKLGQMLVIQATVVHPDGPIIKDPAVPQFAVGGLVRGPGTGTSDSIPALLSNGEYVVKASAVQRLGTGFLNMLNQGLPLGRFAGGGLVNAESAALTAGSGMPHLGSLDLNLGGQSYTVYVENPVADQLGRAARKFGRTHR